MSKQVIAGSGWKIIKQDAASAVIHLASHSSLTNPAYQAAAASLANIKYVRIICDFVN